VDYVVKRPTSAPPEVKEELEETKVQFVLFLLFVLFVCLNRPRLKKGVNSRLLGICNNSKSRDFASTQASKTVCTIG
jgi:hypothetical protein